MTSKKTLVIAGIFLVLLAALVGFTLLNNPQHHFIGTLISPPAEAYDINLADARGSNFRLSDQLGKVVLIFFGYTHCTDVCPTTLADYRAMYEQLGNQTDLVKFVYITVDPERDTPEIIDRYAKALTRPLSGYLATKINCSRYISIMVCSGKKRTYNQMKSTW